MSAKKRGVHAWRLLVYQPRLISGLVPRWFRTAVTHACRKLTDQIQDLADQVREITRLAPGMELRFTVQVELAGANAGAANTVVRLNEVLASISEDLKLR